MLAAIRIPPPVSAANAFPNDRSAHFAATDRTIIWKEGQLRQLLDKYLEDYNTYRSRSGLNQRAPDDGGDVSVNRSDGTQAAVGSSTSTATQPEPSRRRNNIFATVASRAPAAPCTHAGTLH